MNHQMQAHLNHSRVQDLQLEAQHSRLARLARPQREARVAPGFDLRALLVRLNLA